MITKLSVGEWSTKQREPKAPVLDLSTSLPASPLLQSTSTPNCSPQSPASRICQFRDVTRLIAPTISMDYSITGTNEDNRSHEIEGSLWTTKRNEASDGAHHIITAEDAASLKKGFKSEKASMVNPVPQVSLQTPVCLT